MTLSESSSVIHRKAGKLGRGNSLKMLISLYENHQFFYFFEFFRFSVFRANQASSTVQP